MNGLIYLGLACLAIFGLVLAVEEAILTYRDGEPANDTAAIDSIGCLPEEAP